MKLVDLWNNWADNVYTGLSGTFNDGTPKGLLNLRRITEGNIEEWSRPNMWLDDNFGLAETIPNMKRRLSNGLAGSRHATKSKQVYRQLCTSCMANYEFKKLGVCRACANEKSKQETKDDDVVQMQSIPAGGWKQWQK
jgi:hypothetical protein